MRQAARPPPAVRWSSVGPGPAASHTADRRVCRRSTSVLAAQYRRPMPLRPKTVLRQHPKPPTSKNALRHHHHTLALQAGFQTRAALLARPRQPNISLHDQKFNVQMLKRHMNFNTVGPPSAPPPRPRHDMMLHHFIHERQTQIGSLTRARRSAKHVSSPEPGQLFLDRAQHRHHTRAPSYSARD